nr:winged helix-turn-helix transcriptional regulator [Candidatus Sigynarchaeota archaeon]
MGKDKGMDNESKTSLKHKLVLTHLHERILAIAREMMEKHYLLNSTLLYSICMRRIKDEDLTTIRSAFNELISNHVLVDGKAITGMAVLDNENRRSIFALIQAHPGLNLSRVAEILALKIMTARWHLKMLEEFKKVRSVTMDGQLVYFLVDSDPVFDKVHFVLNKKKMADIIRDILDKPGITLGALQSRTDLPRTTLLRKIGELMDTKVVEGDYDKDKKVLSIRLNPAIIDVVSHHVL